MGFDYRLTFSDGAWYRTNIALVAQQIRKSPTFVAQIPPDEFRLKDRSVAGSSPYDLRIFVRPLGVEIEVSAASASFHDDVRTLLECIRRHTPVELVDDDGAPVQFEGNT